MACTPENLPPPGTDRRLLPFLTAVTEEEAERALRSLLSRHADPVIEGVIRRYWRGPPGRFETEERCIADNARSDVLYETVRRLRLARAGALAEPIANLPAYVAVTAFHVCDHAIRTMHPERHRLKLRIRTVLAETPGLALWEDGVSRVAGFADWREQGRRPNAWRLRASRAEDTARHGFALSGRDPRHAPLADVVASLLDGEGGPMPFEELVDLTARLLEIREPMTTSLTVESDCGETDLEPADSGASLESRVELRDYLARLWLEIRELPIRQRTALLLNLRGEEGRDGVDLFPLSHIASRDEIAEALEMAPPAMADLWDGLPLDDATIGRRLGCTRAQVIGLRNAAKHRLRRHMNASECI